MAVVAGDGPEFARLQTTLVHYGLQDQVYLLGTVANERIRELVGRGRHLLSALLDGRAIAVSIFEAMACGLPVVGAGRGRPVAELVTPECGVLVESNPGRHGTDAATEARQYADILARLPERSIRSGRS